MNLYLLTQDDNNGWDTYDSCIVCAETEEEAIKINPDNEWENKFTCWASKPELVDATFIGVASDDLEKGVVLASFNAG